MPRYIDADEIQYTMLYKENWITNTGVEKQGVWKDDIDKMPTADVVEVVRCKDCRWWDNENDAERCAHKYGGMWAKPDGYCNYGERAEE